MVFGRSEESSLFDFEVRFRTAAPPAGEDGLLRCLRHLRDEIVEDFPPEVLLQRPGSFGRLLSLLRWAAANVVLDKDSASVGASLSLVFVGEQGWTPSPPCCSSRPGQPYRRLAVAAGVRRGAAGWESSARVPSPPVVSTFCFMSAFFVSGLRFRLLGAPYPAP